MSFNYKDLHNSNHTDLRMRLSLLYANSLGGLVVSFLCMSVLCFGFDNPELETQKFLLWCALVVSHTLRVIDSIYTQRNCLKKGRHLKAASLRLSLGFMSNGLIFACFSLLFVTSMKHMEITVSAVIFSALAGGAITILAASFFLSVFYMSCLLLPFAVMGLYHELDYIYYLSFLGFIFWAVMLASANEASQFMNEVLHLKSHNASMLKQVANEKKEYERMNEELSVANSKLDSYAHRLKSEVATRTEEIYRLSNIDPLTGLNNRTTFLQEFNFKLSKDSRSNFALLYLDLDGFKDINDGFGNQIGDEVLKEVGKRLSLLSNVFDPDAAECIDKEELATVSPECICRWGGDEFFILCKLRNEEELQQTVKQIINDIKAPMVIEANTVNTQANIGIATFPKDGRSADELIQYANIAMYHQKQGQNAGATYFSSQLLEVFQRNQMIRDGLNLALNNHEFSLMFQPIIDTQQNRVWAFEALLRWKHKGKFIGPDEFIPVAEKTGHIVSLGKWVLYQACLQAAQWKIEDQPALSVNVSALQLLDPSFIESVDDALNKSGLSPTKLHLEITESVMIEESKLAQTHLQDLVKRDIHISIDDFGTGYSSLSKLHTLAFDIVKIDRSFINKMSENDRTIVSATKLIADEFKARTVAEGIEDESELNAVNELGIRYIQGYYFAKPMPFEKIDLWYKTDFLVKHTHQNRKRVKPQ